MWLNRSRRDHASSQTTCATNHPHLLVKTTLDIVPSLENNNTVTSFVRTMLGHALVCLRAFSQALNIQMLIGCVWTSCSTALSHESRPLKLSFVLRARKGNVIHCPLFVKLSHRKAVPSFNDNVTVPREAVTLCQKKVLAKTILESIHVLQFEHGSQCA